LINFIYFVLLGLFEDGSSNKLTYLFYLQRPNFIEWHALQPSKPTTTSSTISIETPSSPSKMVIIGTTVGSIAVILTVCIVFSLIYRRKKRNKMEMERGSGHPDEGALNEVR